MLTEWMVPPKWIEFICVNLCLSACICGQKKRISLPQMTRDWPDGVTSKLKDILDKGLS